MAANETDIAEGQLEADNAPKYRRGAPGVAEANGALSGLGLEAVESKTEEGFVDPGVVQVLYHRYDGRQVVVPAYMSPKLLAARVAADAPKQYANQSAWQTVPNDNYVPGKFMCILHEDQTPEIKEELASIGVASGRCSKAHIHTEFDLNRHHQLKHKAEWGAILGSRTRTTEETYRNATLAQSDAMVKLTEQLASLLTKKD